MRGKKERKNRESERETTKVLNRKGGREKKQKRAKQMEKSWGVNRE